MSEPAARLQTLAGDIALALASDLTQIVREQRAYRTAYDRLIAAIDLLATRDPYKAIVGDLKAALETRPLAPPASGT